LNRTDANESFSESFSYDGLNRLTQSSLSLSPTPLVKTFSYDAIGNLLTKSDLGTYTYPASGSSHPHAVTGIGGSSINTTFTYDLNGNQTSGLGRAITYSSSNMPTSITRGTTTISFSQDVDHQRFKQAASNGTTLYLNAFGVRVEMFKASVNQWNEYLTVDGNVIGERFERSDGTALTRYFHSDHLSSVAVITDENGAVVERNSYDAWGKRRFANGTDDPTGSVASLTTRGFAGQEELDSISLIHMNARIYDPVVGRFTGVDTMIGDPLNGQALNGYSYVLNNPLSHTDLTGNCIDSCTDETGPHSLPPIYVDEQPEPDRPKSSTLSLGGVSGDGISVGASSGSLPGNDTLGFGELGGFYYGIGGVGIDRAGPSPGTLSVGGSWPSASLMSFGSRGRLGSKGNFASGFSTSTYSQTTGVTPGAASGMAHATLMAGSFAPSALGSTASFLDSILYFSEDDWTNGGIALAAAGVGIASDAGLARVALKGAQVGVNAALRGSTLSRSAAFRLSKELGGVPRSTQPLGTWTERLRDQPGSVQSRVYEFLRGDGNTVTIREHSLGHTEGNLGPHFNVEVRPPGGGPRQPLAGGADDHVFFELP
jgi:RHS repeat-associated protein